MPFYKVSAITALLNAHSYDVAYPLSVEAVIVRVQQAYATGNFESVKNELAAYNELGCPLN